MYSISASAYSILGIYRIPLSKGSTALQSYGNRTSIWGLFKFDVFSLFFLYLPKFNLILNALKSERRWLSLFVVVVDVVFNVFSISIFVIRQESTVDCLEDYMAYDSLWSDNLNLLLLKVENWKMVLT